MPNDGRQYIDNRQMQSAPVHGELMSEDAKHRAVVQKQVVDLQQRATTMGVSLGQYVNLQDAGQIPPQSQLPVPQEFREHLALEQQRQQQAIRNVQRQPPQPPSQYQQPPPQYQQPPPQYQQPLPPQYQPPPQQYQQPPQYQAPPQQYQQPPQYQDPMLQQAQQAVMPPQAMPTMDQQVAPHQQQIYDQAAAAQIVQMIGPDPTNADLASLDALMGAAPDMGIVGEDYDVALQHIQQRPPVPVQQPTAEEKFINVEQMPPGVPPALLPQRKPSSIAMLKHPMWQNVDNLLLWESFCVCLMEADAHLVREPTGHGKQEITSRLSKYQKTCDLQGEDYLKEIEKRARHRAMLTRRLTILGKDPTTINRLAKEYQNLLGPINFNTTPDQVRLDRALAQVNDEPICDKPLEEQTWDTGGEPRQGETEGDE